jgi:hypothetical protein
VAHLFGSIFRSGSRVDLVPTRANGQLPFGGLCAENVLGAGGPSCGHDACTQSAAASSRVPVPGAALVIVELGGH